MNSLKKHSNLFEIAPNLVKEWHPSANGNLTPRNVNIGYAKKVWWLCREGHEWEATIKSRMNQNDCPICEKEEVKKETDETSSIPRFGKNRRKNKRFKTNALVVLEVPASGHWVYAEIKDFSRHGLCIEADSMIRPGSAVKVKFDKDLVSFRLDKSHISSNTNGYKTYNSTVKWYRRLDEDQSISNFNIGLELG